ncbi:unnamed protein product [Periconia digitata]|uniref:Uncharacterized protein n=1 Tax=Periconia digitata TaxID=1303443 RepID=A0A9W4UIE1_9PLEO|nr:unnamed protein product [Periconia digitata]
MDKELRTHTGFTLLRTRWTIEESISQKRDNWKNVPGTLWNDLKTTSWKRAALWCGLLIWFVGLLAVVILVTSYGLLSDEGACGPDGDFRVDPSTYKSWSPSAFFQVTLSGGPLTFAQAKAIDVTWDIIIGRGGQFALAFVSWRVFANYLTTCMEVQPINYQLFRSVFLENDASLASTYLIIKNFFSRGRLRSVTAMIFIASVLLYIAAFPTIISAMSGYDSEVASYVMDSNQNLVPFSDYSRLAMIVHDAGRIGLEDDYVVTMPDPDGEPVFSYYSRCYNGPENPKYGCKYYRSFISYIRQSYNNSDQPSQISLTNDNDANPDLINKPVTHAIGPPRLNITCYMCANPEDIPDPGPIYASYWWRANEVYDNTAIRDNGKCQNQGTYKWGFSLIQLAIGVVMLLLWTIGMFAMWLRAHLTMKIRDRQTSGVAGKNRAVLELAESMQKELGLYDIEPHTLRESELEERIKKEARGGAIAYAYPDEQPPKYNLMKGLKGWYRREKWWIGAVFVVVVLLSTMWMVNGPLWYWCLGEFLALIFGMCIGSTTSSRIFMVFILSVVDAIIVISLAASISN